MVKFFYHANRRRQRVDFTTTLREATEAAIASARLAVNLPIPAPIEHKKKCDSCSLQGICLPFEVKQLRMR